MKVVVATTTGFHLKRLAVELRALVDDVEYFSYTPRHLMKREGFDRAWSHSLFTPTLPTSAVTALRGTRWQLPAVESLLAKTDRLVARRLTPADVYVGLSSMSIRSAARAKELGAIAVVDRGARHVESQQALITEAGGRPLTALYVERELASYEAADYITVPSSHAAQSFLARGFSPERLFVCPLGVDFRRFEATPRPAGHLHILYVGRWSSQKGVDVLTEAVMRRANWHLTHVGTLDDMAFPTGHPRFTRLGQQTHEQISAIMADHHLLVLPSRQDGFGMVLLEALAAGLPVVASEMTGGPDIRASIEDPQWVEIVAPGDVDDLERGIDAIEGRDMRQANRREPRSRLSASDKQLFSWAGYGQRYADFLYTVTQRTLS